MGSSQKLDASCGGVFVKGSIDKETNLKAILLYFAQDVCNVVANSTQQQ